MTNYTKTLLTYVERNMVIPGCPKPMGQSWVFRHIYLAPWPQQGVSYLNQDGVTYSDTHQAWTQDSYKSWDNMAGTARGGPPQLTVPLSSSARARAQQGSGGFVHTNVRQGQRPRMASPVRDSGDRRVKISHTYDSHKRSTQNWSGHTPNWGQQQGYGSTPTDLPPKYKASQEEATTAAPPGRSMRNGPHSPLTPMK